MIPPMLEEADVEVADRTAGGSKSVGDGFRFTHWPTEFRHINQPYNNNPDYYGQFGLTGHEGLDIQAPLNSRVFAVAPGEVERIVRVAEGRPYGNAVYLRHPGGYRTAYAHLQQIMVTVGEQVVGGQLLGMAGDTGNCFGAHLHLTLYLDQASARGLTAQPRDIIDPTPYINALRAAEWTAPSPPYLAGWGWAQSIDRFGDLGKVASQVNINLRARPDQNAAKVGTVPGDTIVRITGQEQNKYFPIQVTQGDLQDRQAAPPTGHDYEFLNFESTAGDYTNVQAGRSFSVTWTVRNSGHSPWSGDFRLAYSDEPVAETATHVRSRLGANDAYRLRELTNGQSVQPGETVRLTLNLVAPTQVGWYGSHWVLQTADGTTFDKPLWLQIGIMRGVEPPPAPAPAQTTVGFGMNINPNNGHALDVERMNGLEWVRFPYWASREQNSPEEAFQKRYRGVIQSYAAAGIQSLLVLHQDTEWGNGPWSNGNWEEYARVFARACGRVAAACAIFGDKVAYQVFNEQDSGFGDDAANPNPSAIGITPENYALVLQQATQAIRENHPGATVLFGGLKTGPHNAVEYIRRVRQQLGGSLPVDALAAHPYGRFVEFAPFNYGSIGRLGDALQLFKDEFPNLPVWITEIGVPGHSTVLGPEHYQTIARYMREVVEEVAGRHRQQVPVLIWFAWSDLMENSGIVTAGGQMKEHISDVLQLMKDLGGAGQVKSFRLGADEAEFLRFETTLENHNAVPAGSAFTNRWFFKNTGDSTWTADYQLAYAAEENSQPLMDKNSYRFGEVAEGLPAEPGDEIALVLAMRAPALAGRHVRSRWELRDAGGETFGHLYADITTVPASTVGSGARRADMAFVADHTVPDDSRIPGGEPFLKQWRVRNTGDRQWGDGFRLIFVEGDLQMARGVASHMVPTAPRGEEVILSVPMVAPLPRGDSSGYQSLWRLQDDHGNFFGEAIWARIVSVAGQAATANLGRYGNPAGWYSQNDPHWQQVRLGNGQQTIGSWGCLLTCQAMLLTAHGMPISPADLNQRLRQLGDQAFEGSVVKFAAPTLLLPGLRQGRNLRSWANSNVPWTEWTGEDPIERIDRALAAGQTVLAQVDQSPNDAYRTNADQHWVILLARTPDGADYLMLDPVTASEQLQNQPLSLMRKYGNPAPSSSHEENLRNAIQSALIYF